MDLMMPPSTIKLLDRLIIKLLDSAAACSMAAHDARGFEFYTVFERAAAERKAAARRLQRLLTSLQHKPPLTGSLLGAVECFVAHYIHRSTAEELTVLKLFDWQEVRIANLFEKLRKVPQLSADTETILKEEHKRVSDSYAMLKALPQRLACRA